MKGLNDTVKEYVRLVEGARKRGEEIIEVLTEVLKPFIPDVCFTLGWDDSGTDVICLWSNTYMSRTEGVSLLDILREELGELAPYIDCLTSICVPEEIASKVRKALQEVVTHS